MVHSSEELVRIGAREVDVRDGNGDEPVLVLMAGMPGAGKSTLERTIGATFGFSEIDIDDPRPRLPRMAIDFAASWKQF
ncbi:MAG: zeta toxin family protein [Chloroflexia bacterium]|nr:zeta toxin family protein [Chloroflexia bacterium]